MSKIFVFTDCGGPETQQLIDRPVLVPGPGGYPSWCGQPEPCCTARYGDISGISVAFGSGIASIILAANVLSARPNSGGSHQDPRLLVLHGRGHTPTLCHPHSGVTTRNGNSNGAGS